jgi:spermidine synthase
VALIAKNKLFFLLFFVSGFCGLLYQVVWVRIAFATFGIVTPVLSVVLSVFMLGLSLGSWAGGKWIERITQKTKISAVFFYGLVELLIGIGAFTVPRLFEMGGAWMLPMGEMDSTKYLSLSALIISWSILPWCVLMGATFPFMMSYLKQLDRANDTGFSFLYLANVVGAMCGTLVTALVLIEALGFSNTLLVAGCSNFAIAIVSCVAGFTQPSGGASKNSASIPVGLFPPSKLPMAQNRLICFILFLTGFASLAMEVIWTRAFTPILKTTIYSFALLLTTYLAATWMGSYIYRGHLRRQGILSISKLTAALALFSLLPVILNDPRLHSQASIVLFSIFPFCAILGYLTPKLIDEYSFGRPKDAGRAYAFNILGCIAGPLFAGYFLLPIAGAKLSLILLAIPLLFCALLCPRPVTAGRIWRVASGGVTLLLLTTSLVLSQSYEEGTSEGGRVVRRDYTATVVASGVGMEKRLLVNGIGITQLTPVTKVMAHLPLALLEHPPQSALVICFGMGTTFRSLMSWNIRTVAVELVPSVKETFSYFFSDAESLTKDPRAAVVIDDGRRFLKRTPESFDLITLDPPPPPEAAGSSLLYSEEFYALVQQRLRKGGILQQWFPAGEERILQAVARSLGRSFPHVRAFHSMEGWGYHFLASLSPIAIPTAAEMISRLPDLAQKDLLEWEKEKTLPEFLRNVLAREVAFDALLSKDERISITDDRPYNEYYFVRRTWAKISRFLN